MSFRSALAVVGCILVLAIGAAGVLMLHYDSLQEARSAGGIIDGFEATGDGHLYIGEGSLCKSIFNEPFETVAFFFRDGSFMTFSTHDDKMINTPISVVLDAITDSGRLIRECLLCVHNHFTPVGPSPGDMTALRYLRAKGFSGTFGIYYTSTGRFLGVEED